jgi:putative aldouronate transport system permease protein
MTALSNTKAPVPVQKKTDSWRSMVAKDWKKHWPLYALITPLIIYYLVWCYGPLYGIIIAFNDFAPRKGVLGSEWVGFRWFQSFFNSPYAFRVIRNTILINVWNLLWGFPTPIILALMLNELRNQAFKRTVQTITYMPFFISTVIICGMLRDFTASDGVFGTISKLFGGTPTNLLGDSKYFQTIYVGSEVWQRIGWDSIIFLSALSAISPELYEAATIDGAGKLKQVYHITLPGIMPTIAILLVLRIGSMMSLGFEKIILLYNGLTYETADVISSYVYRKGIVEANFSFATAVNLFQSLINFALVIFANRMSRKLSETSLW